MPRRRRRKQMYFEASSLFDGTVLAAYPIRKPADRIIKRDGLRIDENGIVSEYLRNGQELHGPDERRFRFQDIIANNLNTRRAIRELVVPAMTSILEEIRELNERLDRMEREGSRSSGSREFSAR